MTVSEQAIKEKEPQRSANRRGPYLPREFVVLTTNECTARCAHCTMNSLPGRGGKLTFRQIKAAIDGLNRINPLKLVCFSGGEPTLLGEDLLDAIAYADGQGILTRIVTNACWASTPEKAERFVRTLLEAGLNELNFSADDYHLPYVPFSYLENAWNAAKGKGFGAVVVANTHGPESKITPEYIMSRFGEMPHRYDARGKGVSARKAAADGTVYLISNGWLQRLGRAAENRLEDNMRFPTDEKDLFRGCPMAVVNPALTPDNHLVTCCGIEAAGNDVLDMGDLAHTDIETIYDKANDNVLLNALIKLGPLWIKNFLTHRAPDLRFPDHYASMCEICASIVNNPQAVATLRQSYLELTLAILQSEKTAAKGM